MILHSGIFERFEIDLKGEIFERERKRLCLKSRFIHPRPKPRAGASDEDESGEKKAVLKVKVHTSSSQTTGRRVRRGREWVI